MRRTSLVLLAFLQVVAFIATLFEVSYGPRLGPSWPLIIIFGIVLAQCSLAAGCAVFGPWRFSLRMIGSGLIVASGAVAIVKCVEPSWQYGDLFEAGFFALLMWIAIQIPLWLCRFLLRARLQICSSATISPIHSQYGIRRLMGLTLFVSVACGLTRLLSPADFVEELKNADWIVFITIASALGLLVSTIAITTLNSDYLQIGLAISAVSAAFIAYGVYSAFEVINLGPPNESMHLACMLLCTYAWLQASILLIRAAGYRIAVGASK